MNPLELRRKLEQKKGQRDQLQKEIVELKSKIRRLRLRSIDIEKAAFIIQLVAQKTQSQLKFRIESPATLALESIFNEDPHSLQIEFPIRRNQTEADLWIEANGELDDPIKGSAGGVIDVVSFALRSGLISLHHPKPRLILILDEPFKMLDKDKQELAGEMLRKVAEKLQIQLLMTTHSPELAECGDKVFIVRKKKGKSYFLKNR